jgi:3-oxoacyl-[acyl-carrier-protein] synthase III
MARGILMNDSRSPLVSKTDSRRSLVEACFRREVGSAASIPGDNVDLIETGILDSMAWVSFLRAVESASGVSDLGSGLNDRSSSLGEIFSALQNSACETSPVNNDGGVDRKVSSSPARAVVAASSAAMGGRIVPPEEVDRAFGMPTGKLRSRAGIESIAYVAEGENELTLGARAAQEALRNASCGAQEIDWIVATSETHHDYPSLSAQLHSGLLLRENCGALDVGGACLGLLNALAVARSLIGSGQAKTVAVVTADVHSRTLTPGRVAGEFGGLFGDGASAFILRSAARDDSSEGYCLGEFLFGCAGQYASAIQVSDAKDGSLEVQFDGEAISRAAITRMEKVITAVELRSGIPRGSVGGFATHQPNPRLVMLLAKQCDVSPGTFPPIARVYGNLGSSTCGAALHEALRNAAKQAQQDRRPIFLASLGPGLLFGGGWLTPHENGNRKWSLEVRR